MARVFLDHDLRRKLLNLSQPVDLFDESGQVVARVMLLSDLDEYEPWEPPISEDELRRREDSDKWYTTEQVLDHLKNLENK